MLTKNDKNLKTNADLALEMLEALEEQSNRTKETKRNEKYLGMELS